MYDILKTSILAGLGLQEKIKESVDELVKKGELNEGDGAKMVREFMKKMDDNSKEFESKTKDYINKIVEKMHFPTKSDIDRLEKEVKEISERLKKIEEAASQKTA